MRMKETILKAVNNGVAKSRVNKYLNAIDSSLKRLVEGYVEERPVFDEDGNVTEEKHKLDILESMIICTSFIALALNKRSKCRNSWLRKS